jgi:DNA-binding protein HU-beta
VVPVFRAGSGFKTLLTRADGVSVSPGSAALEGGVRKAKGKKSQAAASGASAGTVVVADDADADGRRKTGRKAGKKAGKKARDQAGGKGRKSARKAAGKQAAKSLR